MSSASDQLTVVGVRHHSPACAQLTAETIKRVKPRWVLIEGPSDMNHRLAELELPHELPIALFSYSTTAEETYSSWSPFCEYSPEWVALRTARLVGAEPLFIDLPAWDPAFYKVENRYSDRHGRRSSRVAALAERLGLEGMDPLWDRLFEQPAPLDDLAARLAVYFDELRADDEAEPRDTRREIYMGQWISWALAEGGSAVVVCGGYHKPALERLWREAPPTRPDVPTPAEPDTRVGTYLVPYSFRRLDSFAGYESGMPSPAFHQTVWERGLELAAEEMLFAAIKRLRSKGQLISPADAIAALTLARGLKALRGHLELARTDVLDGIAGALVKHALDAPLPWTQRGLLRAGTDPLLVEVVAAFSGEKRGKLGRGTPRPPLLPDVEAELERFDLTPTIEPKRVTLQITSPKDLARSRVLHRLRVLGIPGFTRQRGPSWSRSKTDLSEEWTIHRPLEAEVALIEAAAYGATLRAAATAKLEEQVRGADNFGALAGILFEAALTGSAALTNRLLREAQVIVAAEPSFTILGDALGRLLGLWKHDSLLGVAGATALQRIIEEAFDRGLWLFEGIRGGSSAEDSGLVKAIVALRDTIREGAGSLAIDRVAAHAVAERRADDPDAPPVVRGAALGLAWSTDAYLNPGEGEQKAIAALGASALPTVVGDFLTGLFALAREEVVHSEGLRQALDQVLSGLDSRDFLIAVPALRLAFSYFPPREKIAFAEGILALHGKAGTSGRELLKRTVDVGTLARGMELEGEVAAMLQRYGLAAGEAR